MPSIIQSSPVAQLCPTPHPHKLQHARLPFPSPTWSLLNPMSIELVKPSNHLILCCSRLLLPSIFPSIKVFSNESVLCIRWPKYWNFSISPSNEYSELISSRIDWLYLLAVQGTLKSLPQHHSSKASILRSSAFFTVQLSHPYMTTGKTIASAIWAFVRKVMSLIYNMPSMFVIASLALCYTHAPMLVLWCLLQQENCIQVIVALLDLRKPFIQLLWVSQL